MTGRQAGRHQFDTQPTKIGLRIKEMHFGHCWLHKGLLSKFLFLFFINILWNCIQGQNFDCNTSCNASICSNKHGKNYHDSFIISSQIFYYIHITDISLPCKNRNLLDNPLDLKLLVISLLTLLISVGFNIPLILTQYVQYNTCMFV